MQAAEPKLSLWLLNKHRRREGDEQDKAKRKGGLRVNSMSKGKSKAENIKHCQRVLHWVQFPLFIDKDIDSFEQKAVTLNLYP